MKNISKPILLFGIAAIVITAFSIFMYSMSINNDDAILRNKYKAQDQVCQGYYDLMWKTIKQEANVSDKFFEDFKVLYKPMMDGRFSGKDQTLFKMITEDNPKFTPELYTKLMVVIEAKREGFFNEQKYLTAIWNEHENLQAKAPGRWFISNTEHIKHQVVTSSITEQVFKTKKDDDIDIFGKKDTAK